MNDQTLDFDDLGEALREGRPLRQARAYRIHFAQGNLNFRVIEVDSPIPEGRLILTSAGLDPEDGYSLFAILPTGDFEDLCLNEPFDLRGHGSERFVAFRTDRIFKLTLNGHQLAWGEAAIKGEELYALAGAGEETAVFLKRRDEPDHLVDPGESIDLAAPGIEHFFTATKPAPTFEIIVNSRPKVVANQEVSFAQVVELAFPGVPVEANTVFSMTYRNVASTPHAGELGAGGVVEVRNGSIFNVTKTVKS